MKKDIQSAKDIEKLIDLFFDKIKKDAVLAPYFTEYFSVNWEKHLLAMTAFWENVIFFKGSYTGNPMSTILHLHKLFPITDLRFEQWLNFFTSSVNELFKGDNAELIKQKATRIAKVMKTKILCDGG